MVRRTRPQMRNCASGNLEILRCAIAYRSSLVSLAPRNDIVNLAAREAGKFLHHALIDRPLERDDQLGKILHRLPAPGDELRLVAAAGTGDVDFGILAG